ncbi:MAG: beta-mannosidase, partial [Oscillospiraceae bacterium]
MKKIISALLSLVMCAGALIAPVGMSMDANAYKEGFVYSEDTHFYLNGKKFYFAGANAYDFFTKQSNGGKDIGKDEIDLRMSQMKEIGINVIRLWGFASRDGYRFEDGIGQYNEGTFTVMDYTMKSAKENGIRVIITLENYWDAYGGIDQKLSWAGLSGGSHANRRQFFTNESCKQWYKDYFNYFANRVNTFTGVKYKDDPTVFAWDMMNEARYCNDSNYSDPENLNSTKLRAWVDEMGAYMKSVDPNHMLCIGLEGHGTKYGFGGNEGNDFVTVQSSEYIDFTSAHPYPDEWWANLTPAQTKTMMEKWIKDSHEVVKKPFMVGEFNVKMSNTQLEDYWRAIFDTIYENDAGGGLFWTFDTRNLSEFHVQITDSIITDYFMGYCEKIQAKNDGSTIIPDVPVDSDTDTAADTDKPTDTDTST